MMKKNKLLIHATKQITVTIIGLRKAAEIKSQLRHDDMQDNIHLNVMLPIPCFNNETRPVML